MVAFGALAIQLIEVVGASGLCMLRTCRPTQSLSA